MDQAEGRRADGLKSGDRQEILRNIHQKVKVLSDYKANAALGVSWVGHTEGGAPEA
jgi:hypothetical protein